jgi:hypothetical protein
VTTTAAENPWGTWRRQRWVVTALALVIALLVALLFVLLDQEPGTAKSPLPAQQVRAGAVLTVHPCAAGASGPFVPTSLEIPGVIKPSTVLALARNSYGVPDVPPLSETGKHEFAWDKGPAGIYPGSSEGNALFNAHTWPWWEPPAYGNLMLKGLHPGGTIVLRGTDVTQCYRVTKQVQVPAQGPYPDFYNRTGPSQIAIIVCSGVRAGPGDWLSRTIWLASPITA